MAYTPTTPPKATRQQSIEYRDKLGDIDATVSTSNNLLQAIAANPVAIIILLLIIVAIIYIFRQKAEDFLTKFWSTITGPMRRMLGNADIVRRTGQSDTSKTLSDADAKRIADAIDASISNTWAGGDDEARIIALVASIPDANSWEKVKIQFGIRNHSKGIFGLTHSHDLEGMLSCNLSNKEISKIRESLAKINVTPNF